MSRLPDQWCLARVRDLITVDPKNDCPDNVDIGFVPLARLGVHYRSRPSFETKTWADVKRGYTHFADGDVLLARITPSFENGKAGVARGLPNGFGAGSTEYIVCRPLSGALLPEYLLAHFKTPTFLAEGASAMSGAVGHQRVPKTYVLDSLIPLAPLNEQQRIIEKLTSVLARVDACRERLDGIPSILRRFRLSVLTAAISGNLTNDYRHTTIVDSDSSQLLETARESHRAFADSIREASKSSKGNTRRGRRYPVPERVDPSCVGTLRDTWAWSSGAELVEAGDEIVYGIVQPGPQLQDGVPYIRGTDIQDGEILAHQLLRTTPEIAGRHSRSALRGGDVLLGIIRSTKVAIVPDALSGANITQGTARFRPSKVIRTKYLAIALEAPATQAWLHERYRGIDMPGLNLSDVRRVPIPLPPLSEQDEIIRCVDNLLASGRRIFNAYSRTHARLERLTPSLLAKAFRGELVPQDPNDEPASRVVDEVRAKRTSQPPAVQRERATRTPTMAQVTSDSLKKAIAEIPGSKFTFDQLRHRVPGDYEALRDALFVLLGAPKPPVRQVFDDTNRMMVLERTQQ